MCTHNNSEYIQSMFDKEYEASLDKLYVFRHTLAYSLYFEM